MILSVSLAAIFQRSIQGVNLPKCWNVLAARVPIPFVRITAAVQRTTTTNILAVGATRLLESSAERSCCQLWTSAAPTTYPQALAVWQDGPPWCEPSWLCCLVETEPFFNWEWPQAWLEQVCPKDGFAVDKSCAVCGWPADVPQALTAMSSRDLKFISSDNGLKGLVQHKSCPCSHSNSSKFTSCQCTSVVEFLVDCSVCSEIAISCLAQLNRNKTMN